MQDIDPINRYLRQSTYNFFGVTVTDVSPKEGPATGGTVVTITGTNFTDDAVVHFGATIATGVTVHSPTSISATAPPGVTDTTVDITVTTPSGTSPTTDHDLYTYQEEPPPPHQPLPPSKCRATITYKRHAHKHKYHLKARWKPSPSDVTSYRIYKRSKVVATIPSTAKLVFKKHLLYRSSIKKFRVAAVDSQNGESARKRFRETHGSE